MITAVCVEVDGRQRSEQAKYSLPALFKGMAERDKARGCPWTMYGWGRPSLNARNNEKFNVLLEVQWIADQTIQQSAARLQSNLERPESGKPGKTSWRGLLEMGRDFFCCNFLR